GFGDRSRSGDRRPPRRGIDRRRDWSGGERRRDTRRSARLGEGRRDRFAGRGQGSRSHHGGRGDGRRKRVARRNRRREFPWSGARCGESGDDRRAHVIHDGQRDDAGRASAPCNSLPCERLAFVLGVPRRAAAPSHRRARDRPVAPRRIGDHALARGARGRVAILGGARAGRHLHEYACSSAAHRRCALRGARPTTRRSVMNWKFAIAAAFAGALFATAQPIFAEDVAIKVWARADRSGPLRAGNIVAAGDTLNKMLAAINSDKRVKIELNETNAKGYDDDALDLLKAFAVDKGPDIFVLAHEWTGAFAEAGYAQNLEDHIA